MAFTNRYRATKTAATGGLRKRTEAVSVQHFIRRKHDTVVHGSEYKALQQYHLYYGTTGIDLTPIGSTVVLGVQDGKHLPHFDGVDTPVRLFLPILLANRPQHQVARIVLRLLHGALVSTNKSVVVTLHARAQPF